METVNGKTRKRKLPQGKKSDAAYELAYKYKRICLENKYTWKTMDEDLLIEAEKLVRNVFSR